MPDRLCQQRRSPICVEYGHFTGGCASPFSRPHQGRCFLQNILRNGFDIHVAPNRGRFGFGTSSTGFVLNYETALNLFQFCGLKFSHGAVSVNFQASQQAVQIAVTTLAVQPRSCSGTSCPDQQNGRTLIIFAAIFADRNLLASRWASVSSFLRQRFDDSGSPHN